MARCNMADPLVCAILLTRERPEMAARAIRSFREQTYQRKRMLIYDTGQTDAYATIDPSELGKLFRIVDEWPNARSIGKLRNAACSHEDKAEIFVHWDDDDYSHPARIAEQVALLQSSGAACVGYSQTLFWDTVTPPAGQAWIYSGAPIGASFAYWRKTWKEHPFEDVSRGEDDRFWRALLVAGKKVGTCSGIADEPRMIHHVHGGNTWTPDYAKAAAHGSNNWRRAPKWDSYCKSRMSL